MLPVNLRRRKTKQLLDIVIYDYGLVSRGFRPSATECLTYGSEPSFHGCEDEAWVHC